VRCGRSRVARLRLANTSVLVLLCSETPLARVRCPVARLLAPVYLARTRGARRRNYILSATIIYQTGNIREDNLGSTGPTRDTINIVIQLWLGCVISTTG
jgi:hypothetical protein